MELGGGALVTYPDSHKELVVAEFAAVVAVQFVEQILYGLIVQPQAVVPQSIPQFLQAQRFTPVVVHYTETSANQIKTLSTPS